MVPGKMEVVKHLVTSIKAAISTSAPLVELMADLPVLQKMVIKKVKPSIIEEVKPVILEEAKARASKSQTKWAQSKLKEYPI